MDSTTTTIAPTATDTHATTTPTSATPAVATTRPRTPRPRSAPRGPAGTGPRGSAGTRPATSSRVRTAPRMLPTHAHFAERLLLVLSGSRPVHWMLGQTVGEAYEQLVQLAPMAPFEGHAIRPVLRSCHVQRSQGAMEAFATIATGERVRAMAFRLEQGADRRWRCAAIELDGLHARVPAQSRP